VSAFASEAPAASKQDFEEVLAGARGGEEWALRAIYEELSPLVRGYLRNQGLAQPDEAAGDVFLQMVRDFSDFDGDEHGLRVWVLTLAHRRLLEEEGIRRPRRLSVSLIREAGGDPGAGPAEEQGEENAPPERVAGLLGGLSPDQRSVVLLRANGDLSTEQVAAVIDRSPRTVKRLERRALSRLARRGDPEDAPSSQSSPPELERPPAHPPQGVAAAPSASGLTPREAHGLAVRLRAVATRARRMQRESQELAAAVEQAIESIEARYAARLNERTDEPPAQADTEERLSSGDEEALLRATQMAIRGQGRNEIEAALRNDLGVTHAAEIVEQILGPGRE
jgi:RNA polymerase sigma factor (sigma-70 family)